MGLTSTSFTSDNQPTHVRTGRTRSPASIVKDAIFKATGKDIEDYWAWVVQQSQKDGGESLVRLIVDRTTPTLKAQMQTVNIDGFPRNGSAIEQAEAILMAVVQGVIPLDFAGPMIAMIQVIDTAKGGSLGNSGMDLSALYQGTDMAGATNFAKQVAALHPKPKPTVIDVTPNKAEPIEDAIAAAATQVLGDLAPDHANGASLIEAAATRLAARYPSNTHTRLYNAICDAINAQQQED